MKPDAVEEIVPAVVVVIVVVVAAFEPVIGLADESGMPSLRGRGRGREIRRTGGEEGIEEEGEESATVGGEFERRIVLEAGSEERNGAIQAQIVVGGRRREREGFQFRHGGR